MRLIDIINSPWAITPDMLAEIHEIYARHMRGEKIDLNGLEARIGAPLNNEPKNYSVTDGVAVLPIDGVVSKRMNLFSKISGGTSSQLVSKDLAELVADNSVQAIVLAVDSPGGTVDGTPELAQAVFEARQKKPVLTWTDGTMASAAYWFGSAANAVNISSNVTRVGSIGVIGKHVDTSAAAAAEGRKVTEIYAGKYKAVGSPHRPLTAEDMAVLQEGVDHAYSVFVEDVARFRETSVDDVLARMADGRVFNGQKAIEAGLVDGVATLAETIEQAREMARVGYTKSRAGGAQAHITAKENIMNLETLKAEHPELVEQIAAEATEGLVSKAEIEDQLRTAHDKGADAERQRIASVREQAIPGHEELIEKLAFDGKSTGADAAMAIVAAEKGLRDQAAKGLEDDAPPVVPSGGDPADLEQKTIKRKDFDAKSQSQRTALLSSGVKIVD